MKIQRTVIQCQGSKRRWMRQHPHCATLERALARAGGPHADFHREAARFLRKLL